MVFLSSRISPFTSTVIFFERSPLATALVTSALLRTCPVKLAAMKFTLSVRSLHVPATPSTLACPPSLPSVPTSRTTRVTSEEKAPSCSTIRLTVLALRRNSPCSERPSKSSAMVWVRSPLATAPMTRAISLVGWTRSPTSVFTDSIDDAQRPVKSPTVTRWVILPSLPTSRASRSSSRTRRWFDSMISLTVSATLPPTPVHLTGSRGAKFPRLSAVSTSSSLPSSTWSLGCWPCPFPPAGGRGVPADRSDTALEPAASGPPERPLLLMSARSLARPAQTRPGVHLRISAGGLSASAARRDPGQRGRANAAPRAREAAPACPHHTATTLQTSFLESDSAAKQLSSLAARKPPTDVTPYPYPARKNGGSRRTLRPPAPHPPWITRRPPSDGPARDAKRTTRTLGPAALQRLRRRATHAGPWRARATSAASSAPSATT